MPTDPTYEYIKGLGWQPFPDFDAIEVSLPNGRFLVQDRKPQIGDMCVWSWSGSRTWAVNYTSKPNLPKFVEHVKCGGAIHLCTPELLENLTNKSKDVQEEIVWVTLVKL